MDRLKLLAEEIAKENKSIEYEPGSILSILRYENSNGVANKLASKLFMEIGLFKNKLRPFMNEYINIFQDTFASYTTRSQLADYKINQVVLPTAATELKDNDIVKLKRNPAALPVSGLSLPQPEEEDLKSQVDFNINLINETLDEFMYRFSENDMADIWEKYLTNISNSNHYINSLRMNPGSKLETIIVVAGIVKKHKDTYPKRLVINEEGYLRVMNEYYEELLNFIAMGIEDFKRSVDNGVLVTNVTDKTVNVYTPVYKKFIKDDYKPEALLGYILESKNKDQSVLIKNIKEKADQYTSVWERKVDIINLEESRKEAQRYKVCYSLALEKVLEDEFTDDLENLANVDVNEEKKAFESKLSELKESELLDVNGITLRLMNDYLFRKTNFKMFTDALVEIQEVNKDISPKSAATLATVDLIVTYIMNKVKTVDRGY